MAQLTDLQLNRFLYKTQPQTLETQSSDVVASNIAPPPSNMVASGNTVTDINTNAQNINGGVIQPGSIPQATLDISNLGWTSTSVFSVVDSDTVQWTSGTFTSASGTAYAISAGNTGNMTQKTYVYLDINVSTTQYQITTNVNGAIGVGRVLIAVCQNAGGGATFAMVEATQITGDNIIANTVDASKIVAGSITATQLSTTLLYAGSITIDTNGNIKGGMTQYNLGQGFFLGYSGGKYKMSVGDSAGNLMLWDGTSLSIIGSISSTSSGQRVVISGTAASFYDSSNTLFAHTYAGSSGGLSGYVIAGDQSNTNIILDAGTTGVVALLSNGTIRVICDSSNNTFASYTDGGMDLGNTSFRWSTMYSYATNVADKMYYGPDQIIQPLIYIGLVNDTAISQSNTVGWSVTHSSTGIYTVTHNLGTTNYNEQITVRAALVKWWSVSAHSSNSFTVRIANASGTLEDNLFSFQMAVNR